MDYSNLSFENDMFNRKTFAENLMTVIEQWNEVEHENNSLVISLDSSWGSGKSYLINMWKNWLINDKKYNEKYYVTYLNAWENDDCQNPFIPLVYKLQDMDLYYEDNVMINDLKAKSKEFLKQCGVAILKDTLTKAIGKETADIVSCGVDSASEVKELSFFESYNLYMQEKEKFKDSLNDLIPDNGKLIIFVDELDRCRPTFAVETLEIVKHYFNIKNIVFIFAVDLEQLAHSIKTMYGSGMDSEGYLRRFFDFNINIPRPNISDYVKLKLKNKLSNFINVDSFLTRVVNIYTKFDLSLRDIDKITNNFTLLILFYSDALKKMIVNRNIENVLEVYLYFITLKYKFPTQYNLILRQQFNKFDDAVHIWPVLEAKFYVSNDITSMLNAFQIGAAHNIDNTMISKYGLATIDYKDQSFSEHIERTIEMFTNI